MFHRFKTSVRWMQRLAIPFAVLFLVQVSCDLCTGVTTTFFKPPASPAAVRQRRQS
jgi:hypothetical protein